MPKPTPFFAAILILGLACGFVLLWIATASFPSQTQNTKPKTQNPEPRDLPSPAFAGSHSKLPTPNPKLLNLAARSAVAARPNEAVLTFKDAAALERFVERAARSGLSILGRSDALRSVRVRYDSLAGLDADLSAHPDDYAAATPNDYFGIPQPPAKQDRAELDQVPFRNDTLAYLGASGDRSAWGRGVTIAVLDTGVASDPTFGTGRLQTLDIGLGRAPGSGPDDGHGTSVAALAAGAASDAAGVAAAANLLSIRVTDASGLSDLFTISQAIVAATDAGAKIINISLGGYATGPALDAAIAYATQKGAILVAAAGNDQAGQLAWPAADPRVLSVGAIDRAEQQVIFSNSSASLQLTAPGYGVQTAWLDSQRAYVDGTSAAAPLVSGALAAVLSQNPSLTAQQAADILLATASDGGAPGADDAYGRGILNVGWAMNRQNPGYVDTAVASHFYDPATNQMQFTLQNRSGRSVTGLSLSVTSGTTTIPQTVPSLAPGETYVARVPVSDTTLRTVGSLTFATQLNNPLGVTDQVPANNRKTTTLSAPR